MSRKTWGDVLNGIDTLSLLEEDWDSYGAVPPEPNAIAGAKKLVAMLEKEGHSIPDVLTATCNGNISFEWRTDLGFKEIEVESLAAAELFWVPKDGKESDMTRIEIV